MRAIGRDLCTLFSAGAVGRLTDAQLLEGFLARREETAFAELVRRHGPMVMGVCRRGLGNHHDAEDAFQATFLVLARNAAAVRPPERLANWLHGVAQRITRKARATAAKQHARETLMPDVPAPEARAIRLWDDLAPLLDQELSRLPERYRAPVVLCDLEGHGRKQAALQLGWPEGTLSSRLSRARSLLADRLRRRGIALSGGALAALFADRGASAAVPLAVTASTARTAVLFAVGTGAPAAVASLRVFTLTERTLRAMTIAKLKSASVLLTLGMALLAAGATGLTGPGGARAGAQVPPEDPTRPPAKLSVIGPGNLTHTDGNSVVIAEGAALDLDGKSRLEFLKKDGHYVGRVVSTEKGSAPIEFTFGAEGVMLALPADHSDPHEPLRQKLDTQRKRLGKSLDIVRHTARNAANDPAVRHKTDQLKEVVKEIEALPPRREQMDLFGTVTTHRDDRDPFAPSHPSDKHHQPPGQDQLGVTMQDCRACHLSATPPAPLPASTRPAQRDDSRIIRDLLVRQARRDIETALERLERDMPDRQTELEALDEIEGMVRAMKDKINAQRR